MVALLEPVSERKQHDEWRQVDDDEANNDVGEVGKVRVHQVHCATDAGGIIRDS